jgi:hypothetical protein
MQRSVNTYFVQLARDVGVERVAEVAIEHGMRWGNLDSFGSVSCSIGLGSAEVFPLGMTMGYGTWTNGGVRCEPYVIERILDRQGEVVYEHEPRCERVVDLETARQMRDVLRGPVRPGGTAAGVGAALGTRGVRQDRDDQQQRRCVVRRRLPRPDHLRVGRLRAAPARWRASPSVAGTTPPSPVARSPRASGPTTSPARRTEGSAG